MAEVLCVLIGAFVLFAAGAWWAGQVRDESISDAQTTSERGLW